MSKAEVKKIKPFPFPITIKIGTHVITGQVLQMTKVGFMMETTSAMVSVGDKPEVEFTLPVAKSLIVCTGVVVKLINQVGGSIRIAEIHFKLLPNDAMEKIANYLTAAGTKA